MTKQNGIMKITENNDYNAIIKKRNMEIQSRHSFGIMKELYKKNGFRALFAGSFAFGMENSKGVFTKGVKSTNF